MAAASDVGEKVLEALRRSSDSGSGLDIDTSKPDLLAATAGEKSVGGFMKGTRSVEVFADFDSHITEVRITPSANGGVRNGYTPLKQFRTVVVDVSSSDVGAAVLAGLAAATL
jgi:hypothetical protein